MVAMLLLVLGIMFTSGMILADQLGFIDGDGILSGGGSEATTGDQGNESQASDGDAGIISDEEPTPTNTPEPEPSAEPTQEESEPTPEPTEPTPTEEIVEPTPEPAEPTPTEEAPPAPTAVFDEPFPGRAIPPGWANGQFETFTRDDFVAGGAYRRDDGVLYDRPAAHLYAQETGYGSTTVTFNVSETPSSYIGILVIGMDDERGAKVPCRLLLNGILVWEGESPFENEEWTRIGWRAGSLGWLQEGENTLTFEVLVDEGEFGQPPWILLNEARVYWG